MGDALAIPALVLQVAATLKQLYDYGKEVSSAQHDIRLMRRELFVINGILQDLRIQAEHGDVLDGGLSEAFEDCKSLLDVLGKKLALPPGVSRRRLQSIKWPFAKNEVDGLLKRLERLKSTFELALLGDISAAMLEIKAMRDDVAFMREVLHKHDTQYQEADLQQVRACLAPTSPDFVHRTTCDFWKETPSGFWFIRDYLDPLLDDTESTVHRIMHLSGISGAGKTTLMSRAADHIQQNRTDYNAVFFYCAYNNVATQETRNILGSWLVQLSSKDVSCLEPLRHFIVEGKQVPITALQEALIDAVETNGPTILILDAVNEGVESSQLVRDILSMCDRSNKIRILISSTMHSASLFLDTRLACFQVDMSTRDVQSDILNYIRNKIQSLDFLKMIPETEAISAISSKANGMFRCASCHINLLGAKESMLTPRALRRELSQLPETLNEAHRALLERVPNAAQGLVREVLLWLSFCLRPLSIEELAEALVLEYGDSTINDECRFQSPMRLLQLCKGLVLWDPDTGNVTLGHSSLRDFLQSEFTRSSMERFWLDERESLQLIIRKCLTYLLMNDFKDGWRTEHRLRALAYNFPLLEYAGSLWTVHFERLSSFSQEIVPALLEQAENLFNTQRHCSKGGNFSIWIQILLPRLTVLSVVQNAEPLYYVSSYGLHVLVAHLLKKGLVGRSRSSAQWYIDHKCGRFSSTALQVACWRGYFEVVKLLLENGADPNSTNHIDETCLDCAEIKKFDDIADILRAWGARNVDY